VIRVLFQPARFGGPFGRLIGWWTGSDWCHCEVVVIERGGMAHRWAATVRDGVHRVAGVDGHAIPPGWSAIDLPSTDAQDLAVLSFLHEESGCGYDRHGVLRAGGVWSREHPDKWFCSELVAAALRRAAYCQGLTPSATTPGVLYGSVRCLPMVELP
jgi:hypothetical protein